LKIYQRKYNLFSEISKNQDLSINYFIIYSKFIITFFKGEFKMSLTDTKSSLKKILSIIEELNGLNSDSVPKLQSQPTSILENIENLEEDKANNLRTIESNDDETNTLKNKISQNQRDITTLEENNGELTNQRQALLDKIQEAQNELNETQTKITARKEELAARTTRLEELENRLVELKDIQEKFDNKMKELETQLQGDFNKKEKFSNSYAMRAAAMKSLIKAGYIQSAQLQVINALVPQTTLEIKGLVSASGLREDVFRSILTKMVQKNGPIEYDEANGTVTLNGEVDF
jgi:chromosome segregation ATPase